QLRKNKEQLEDRLADLSNELAQAETRRSELNQQIRSLENSFKQEIISAKTPLQDRIQALEKQLTDGETIKTQLEQKISKLKEKQSGKKKNQKISAAEHYNTNQSTTESDKNKPLEPGDTVKLEGQSVPGQVIEINGKDAVVAFGQLITTVKCTRLHRISKNEYKKSLRQGTYSGTTTYADRLRDKKLSFSPDIDVRGMRAEEAVTKVLNHLDEALLCGAGKVKILHGKGNGILRELIRQHIATLSFVSRYHDEHVQYGGSGVTIVELD
ncbi:MAG: Smr/MutS family protein, partial [Bacteroidota bacterium]